MYAYSLSKGLLAQTKLDNLAAAVVSRARLIGLAHETTVAEQHCSSNLPLKEHFNSNTFQSTVLAISTRKRRKLSNRYVIIQALPNIIAMQTSVMHSCNFTSIN